MLAELDDKNQTDQIESEDDVFAFDGQNNSLMAKKARQLQKIKKKNEKHEKQYHMYLNKKAKPKAHGPFGYGKGQ